MNWKWLIFGAATQIAIAVEITVNEGFPAARINWAVASILLWMAVAAKTGKSDN